MSLNGESLLAKAPGIKRRASALCSPRIALRCAAEDAPSLAPRSTRVLLVEDRGKDARTLESLLRRIEGQSFEVAKAVGLSAALEQLPGMIDVILLDLAVPGASGLERISRVHEAAPDKPIVALTGYRDEQLAVDAMYAHAQDCLVKWDFDENGLARCIRHAVERKRMLRGLEDAVRLRDEQLRIAAHDLRSPLSVIQLRVESLVNNARVGDCASRKLLEELRAVQSDAVLMDRLIGYFLDLSRLDPLEVRPALVDLAEVVRDVVERLKATADRTGCGLTFEAKGPVLGNWDGGRLDQAATNLISNALKYGEGKPVAVAVSYEGKTATLRVQDEGCGILRQDQTRIFGQFQRAAWDSSIAGTGLGLWIVRRIVEAHRGRVEVESELGKGSVFTVQLPL